MIAISARRSPRIFTIGLVRRCRLDRGGDHDPLEAVSFARLCDPQRIQAERMRDAERVLEFMRVGGGVLVHR